MSPDSLTNPAEPPARFVVFAGHVRLKAGSLAEVAVAAWRADRAGEAAVLVFDRTTGAVVDLDLRGGEAEVQARHESRPAAPKRGRPKLGVTAREVTLLPRHWEWLARQPGGASTTLRRLVEEARRAGDTSARERIEAAYRFMVATAGDLPAFDEAARALFAHDRDGLGVLVRLWPSDVKDELMRWLEGSQPTRPA